MAMRPRPILTEKSISDLFKVYRKLPENKFNYAVVLAIGFFGTVYSLISTYIERPYGSRWEHARDMIGSMTPTMIGAGAGILGVWIAGFAIFTSITNVRLFVFMNSELEQKTGQSYLKYTFILFFGIMIQFLVYIVLMLIITFFFAADSVMDVLIGKLFNVSMIIKSYIYHIIMIFVLAYSVYVVLLLKSFAFNIYQVIALAVEYEQNSISERSSRQDNNGDT